jgi:hypothetical protein
LVYPNQLGYSAAEAAALREVGGTWAGRWYWLALTAEDRELVDAFGVRQAS